MKEFLAVFSILVILMNTAFIQDKTSTIQQELIDVIKTEFAKWSADCKNDSSPATYLIIAGQDSIVNFKENNANGAYTFENNRWPNGEFYDFKFKITSHQAIVQFNTGNRLKSAFLEKKDGKWLLICCADLSPVF